MAKFHWDAEKGCAVEGPGTPKDRQSRNVGRDRTHRFVGWSQAPFWETPEEQRAKHYCMDEESPAYGQPVFTCRKDAEEFASRNGLEYDAR